MAASCKVWLFKFKPGAELVLTDALSRSQSNLKAAVLAMKECKKRKLDQITTVPSFSVIDFDL